MICAHLLPILLERMTAGVCVIHISCISSNISKTSASVSSGFQTRETFESTRPQAERFYCFRTFGNLMKHEARGFEITSPTKEN